MLTLLRDNKVIPVTAINRVDDGLRLSELLLENSINIIEITLRTGAAFEVIKSIRSAFPEMTTGAGSILDSDSLKKAADSGAVFGVAPCFDPEVVDAAEELNLPFVPGIATPSELSSALKRSNLIKIFPAASLGGTDYIKAIAAPFALKNFKFMPTGGVNEKNLKDYLALDSVAACGMTWIADPKLIEAGDFKTLKERIKSLRRIS